MSTAVGFSSATLLAPYQEIIAGGSTNWVIYGLTTTSASNELKLVDSGTGGLEELEDEFGGGQVLWAFVRVKDPGSGLNKFVLINWLGEGVPDAKKGLFPSHSAAVAKFLKGYHVSLNARHDNDVTPALVLKRVADSSGSKYSVHNEPAQPYRAPAPVTSSYVPIGRPTIVQSRPTPPPTVVGTSYASKQNELAEIRKTQAGLVGTKADPPVAPMASRPIPAFTPAPAPVVATPSVHAPAASDRPGPVGTSYTPISLAKPGKLGNRWGQAQAQEHADKFAPQTTTAASAVTGVASTPTTTGSKPLTWSERQALAKKQREEEDKASMKGVVAPAPAPASTPTPAPVMPARIIAPVQAPAVKAEPVVEPELEVEQEEEVVAAAPPPPDAPPPPPYISASGETIGGPPAAPVVVPVAPLAALSLDPKCPVVEAGKGGQRARVLFEYIKDEDNEMDLVEGELLDQVEQIDEGWWSAVGAGGKSGLFPANYVELIPEGEGEEEKESTPIEASGPPPPPPAPPAPPFVAAAVHVEEAPASGAPSATALYDYTADEEGELSFAEGDVVIDIEMVSDTWWSGTLGGETGVFPSNYVELL